ncbi:MAG TPA: HAMP domain-containing sensor histidine kinase [Bacteroidales bacterium]|nr:HAMP domain-containing sensor histidine kinase [Bacteroidales bacterium]HSA44544.1 HAMP domain-containing sensor histidine kinase [Bacteroidales bacterium]
MWKRLLTTIIVLTSIALAGLIGIQVYWIQSSVKVKEENFSRSVTEAVNNVVYKLEKLEAINEIQRTMSFLERGTEIYGQIDSVKGLYLTELVMLSARNATDSLILGDTSGITIRYQEEKPKTPVPEYDTTFVNVVNRRIMDMKRHIYLGEAISEKGTPASLQKRQRERLKKLYKEKSSLINDVLEDMFNVRKQQSIESRIDFRLLDSLITAELSNKGISAAFEFGIFSPRRNLMVMEKTGYYHQQLMRKSFVFNLFPNEVMRYPEYLMVYFPHETRYILSQVKGMLIISIVFILVIIGSFTYTIFTILRQKKLSEMKNDFINNMTHEFKTPISTVSLACETLTDKDVTRTPGLVDGYIGIIREENQRLGKMAEKILQTAILEKGQVRLKHEVINVHLVLEEIIRNMRIQVELRGGGISTGFQAGNPLIEADRMHITNVFLNLLDNANKYSPEAPVITVYTADAKGGVNVVVQDQGLGISKANQKRIFDKLYRVSTGNIHDVKGFGLGLSYVRFIVEKHGGKVSVQSELNKGSRFIVFLPFHIRQKLIENNSRRIKPFQSPFPWKS